MDAEQGDARHPQSGEVVGWSLIDGHRGGQNVAGIEGSDLVNESRLTETSLADADRLIAFLADHPRLVVAFSGGVDSSVVLAAALRARLEHVVAMTASSESVARWQLELSKQIAAHLQVEHWVSQTSEVSRLEYQRNDRQRCYFCKQTLYTTIEAEVKRRLGDRMDTYSVASGTNADDLGDYRPGIEAGREQGVLTPLADLGIGKERVRELAQQWGLPNHDLPASPCLASRIAYGVEVTSDRLDRVERAEKWLYQRGFREFRVRLHAEELARIEVGKSEQTRLCELDSEGGLTKHFRQLGFQFVTLDLEGFRSGSLNRTLVSIDIPVEDNAEDSAEDNVGNADHDVQTS